VNADANTAPLGARILVCGFIGAFTLASLVLLAIAAGTTVQRTGLIFFGSHADGTVVAKRQSPQKKDGIYQYAPVVRFTAGDGVAWTVTSDVSGPESTYRFGQHLPILYRPDDPQGACIDGFGQLWMLPLVTGVVGAGFSVVPLIVISAWRRRRRIAAGEARPDDAVPGLGRAGRRVLGSLLTVGGLALAGFGLATATASPAAAIEARVLGGCVGVMLAASGVIIAQWVAEGSRNHDALGALVVTAMAVMSGWVAFFGEASRFSGGVSVGGVAVGTGGGVGAARIAFGLAAGLMGLVALWGWKRVLRPRS
jgi:hypothetical protein